MQQMDMQLHQYKISLFTRKRNRIADLPLPEFKQKDIVWKSNT